VRNVPALRAALISKTLDVAIIDAALVPSPACIASAATRALFAAASGKLVAASLHAEIINCLHAGRNVGEALRVLGPRADGSLQDLLFVVVNAGGSTAAEAIAALVEGDAASVSAYYGVQIYADGVCLPPSAASCTDVKRIVSIYRIPTLELILGHGGPLATLEAAVLSRIGVPETL
jgi:hypothetical protein